MFRCIQNSLIAVSPRGFFTALDTKEFREVLRASFRQLVRKCRRLSRNSTILVERKPRAAKKWRTRKKWRPPAGTRGTARARACSPTNAPNPAAVLSATNARRAVTNAPRAYPVPLATNDPRVATRGTRAAAVVSATKGPSLAAITMPDIEGTKACTL